MKISFPSSALRGLLVAVLLGGLIPGRGWSVPCNSSYQDFGDAPENIQAYPSGVVGHFPTCIVPTAAGTQDILCGAAVSTFPGMTGYVVHHELAAAPSFWLGCYPSPFGIDTDMDGKVAILGQPGGCLIGAPDCTASMGALTFAQDECFGDATDAGLAAMPLLPSCGVSHVDVNAFSCAVTLKVYLNVLIDWNQDGDWNDRVACGATCAREWAVKNVPYMIGPGCNPISSPNFRVGPNTGEVWMRITLSSEVLNDDFPWAGSVTMPGGFLHGGETEDYPVSISPGGGPPMGCSIDYTDFGDAPEGIPAYTSGIVGHFPTCTQDTDPGTLSAICVPTPGTAPGPTGFVRHQQSADDVDGIWFGCSAAEPPYAVDSELDGKVGFGGGGFSACNDVIPVDCVESVAAGFSFGQDECYGDADAGLPARVAFTTCTNAALNFRVRGCSDQPLPAYLNVLVDWNQDGDWNDVVPCGTQCVPEWALKNQPVTIDPGCGTLTSPPFLVGGQAGAAWMRTTLSFDPVPDDFPWRGSAGLAGQSLRGGETEDYPVDVVGPQNSVDASPALGGLWLSAAQPCPARTSTTLTFGLAREGHASLVIYDLVGRRVRGLSEGTLTAGSHRAAWDFRDDSGIQVPAGTYFVRLRTEAGALTRTAIRIQ